MSMKQTDFEVASEMNENVSSSGKASFGFSVLYILYGCIFGLTLYKSEAVNWFRIQEMFRLKSFHMFGIIGSAVIVGMLSVFIIKRFRIKTIAGDPITFSKKEFSKGQIIGGLIFGFGWAITGACPGPLYVQIGAGYWIVGVTLLFALVGTWLYGWLRPRLPH